MCGQSSRCDVAGLVPSGSRDEDVSDRSVGKLSQTRSPCGERGVENLRGNGAHALTGQLQPDFEQLRCHVRLFPLQFFVLLASEQPCH